MVDAQDRVDATTSIRELRQAVDEFCQFIRQLPSAGLMEKAWGPKEVLAHLVFWQESYLAQARAILAGEPFEPPRGRFEEMNAQVVAASRGVPVEKLLRHYREVNEQLCHLAQIHDLEGIALVLKKGAAPRPLTWFIAAEAEHARDHLQTLLRQARRDPIAECQRLREAMEALSTFVRRLPAAARAERGSSLSQTLAHLVVYHETCVDQIEARLAGRPFELPQGEGLSSLLFETTRDTSTDELLRRLQVANERLRGFGQTLDPQNVVLELWRLEMRRGSTWFTLDDVIARTEAHLRDHLRRLRTEYAGGEG